LRGKQIADNLDALSLAHGPCRSSRLLPLQCHRPQALSIKLDQSRSAKRAIAQKYLTPFDHLHIDR
jgi:hypothetical protein